SPPSQEASTNLHLEGDAYLDGFLRLTKGPAENVPIFQSVGRATYSQPFLLQDNATGKLADFTTTFTFAIDSQGQPFYADGLAFFLAPNGSALNSEIDSRFGLPVMFPQANESTSIGRGGLFDYPVKPPGTNEATNLYPFVAVEFDVSQNLEAATEDPTAYHVGINVNSVKSKVTRAWNGGITEGRVNSASIHYDSGSKNLSVTFTTYENGVWVENGAWVDSYLYYKVDLNEILQGWVIVGFSAASGSGTAMPKINSWSFNSTSLIVENANNNTPVAPAPTPIVEPGSGNGINIGLVVGLVVGGCVLLVGGFCLVWFIFWKKGGTGESSDNDEDPMINDPIDDEFEKGTGPKKFSYKMLAQSTNDFDEGEKLGEGGFGGVYRGFVKDLDSNVAVKRVSSGSRQGLKEYAAEVRIISRLRHRNLVQLIGWCHEKRELLLVYEFMSNGSLDSHLFKGKSLLGWEARYRIAQGLASGLFYLHEEWEQCVLHRDI
ncbi:PREDICTED: L-type lectin-domain containing receptor kinase IX.1-like, partial [Prunus mume]|uniref:L-type lectin-domain containing receptor kinase IX.1-like n=1 Tax=Prunus mume TaxID=102107 RepID=A0ABM0PXG2_PRUMU